MIQDDFVVKRGAKMRGFKTKRNVLLLVVTYVVSLIVGVIMCIDNVFPIENEEILVKDTDDGFFYLMETGSQDTKILKVDSQGKIIDRNIMKVSSTGDVNIIVEYEGSCIESNDGYVYCVRRWIDESTMFEIQRDVVRLNDEDLSKKPEIIRTYQGGSQTLPLVTQLFVNNNVVYVSLIDKDGSNVHLEKIEFVEEGQQWEPQRLLSIGALENDIFSDARFSLSDGFFVLTNGGKVYTYNLLNESKLIYPLDMENDFCATLISVDKSDNQIYIYDSEKRQILYNKDARWQNIFEDSETPYNNIGFKQLLNRGKYEPLYIDFAGNHKNMAVLLKSSDPEKEECKIIKIDGNTEYKIYDSIFRGSNFFVYDVLVQANKVFVIIFFVEFMFWVISYVIKRGRKIVYKFMLVLLPVLVVSFVTLGYQQLTRDKEVFMDFKESNAMTVNHAIMNNLDTSLIKELRDNKDSYWNGTYKKVLDSIKISENIEFKDISEDVLMDEKVTGIDSSYIYNDIFFIKNDRFYTGVSVNNGYMVPMGMRYFEGTESLFDEVRKTGSPKVGTIVSKYYRNGVYVSPILHDNEMIGVLSTTFEKYSMNKFVNDGIYLLISVALIILFVVLLIVFIMFSVVLSPLKELKVAMEQISTGNYSVKMVNARNDEFSYIRDIFNKMCDKLSSNIYRINNISESYFRFVPRHIFDVLEKEDILDVKLGDKKKIDCVMVSHLLYNFNQVEQYIVKYEGDNLSNTIRFVNRYFNIVYNNLEDTQGLLLTHDLNLTKIETMFLKNYGESIKYSVNIIKKIVNDPKLNEYIKLKTGIIIYKASVLYGVVGEEKRAFPFVVSVEKDYMNEYIFNFENSGAKVIVTEDVKESAKDGLEFNFRYIGYSFGGQDGRSIKMYEVLDCCDVVERQQKQSTLVLFKEALDLFYQKEFYSARNMFSNVVKQSPMDNIARWYLFLSNKYCNQATKNYKLDLYGDKDIKIE